MRNEANFKIEASFLDEGEVYVDKDAGIDIARSHRPIPRSRGRLITNLAKGQNLSKTPYAGDYLKKTRGSCRGNASQVFRISVFGTGFFHGDLHPATCSCQRSRNFHGLHPYGY